MSLKLILRGSLPPSRFKKGEEGLPRQAGPGLRKNFKLVGILIEPRKLKGKEQRPRGGKGVPQPREEQSILGAETQKAWDLRA